MSASHFGSGYWPDDYFGLYFQPEAGGVVIGALSGSFAGASSFTGTLEQPAAEPVQAGGAHGRKRGRELQAFLDELVEEPAPAFAPVAAREPAPVRRAVVKIEPKTQALPDWDEEEELILMLLAA